MFAINVDPEIQPETPIIDFDALVFMSKGEKYIAMVDANINTIIVFCDESQGRPVLVPIPPKTKTYEEVLSRYYDKPSALRQVEQADEILIEFSLR